MKKCKFLIVLIFLSCSISFLSASSPDSLNNGKQYIKSVVWDEGEDGIEGYRIPGIVVTPKGTVLAFSESRITYADEDPKHLVMKRSIDGGLSWSQTYYIEKSDGRYWKEHREMIDPVDTIEKQEVWTNVAPLVDKITGRIYFFYSLSEGAVKGMNLQRYTRVFYRYSDDEGESWSDRVEITDIFHVKESGRPNKDENGRWIKDINGFPCDFLGRAFHMPGPGHGIQLSSGRLLLQVWHRKNLEKMNGTKINVSDRQYGLSTIYSDDHGKTWRHGSFFGHDGLNMNESRMVELDNGDIYINARYTNNNPTEKNYYRVIAISHDGGITWSKEHIDDKNFPLSNSCDGGLARLTSKKEGNKKSRLLYSKNESLEGRKNLVVRISYDEGLTWNLAKTLDKGRVAYSDIAVLPDKSILVLYETEKFKPMYCVKFNLEWLTDGKDSIEK
ncbi:exo-alpha-sialidase [Parabacteroides sp. Marseille-P3160]|uniref:sialidase family protein n=1 Tax=Parabacteroides sp. Marseille-P3160 TaxID=1917887 RepID=UPI0009B9CEE0|nr:sialidase family protein [Parabacteroides sp. Marseille-P3160]